MAPPKAVVEARDRTGSWYVANILSSFGEGDDVTYKVHYKGYGKGYDELVEASRVRARDPDGEEPVQDGAGVNSYEGGGEGHVEEDTWEVETILKKRRVAGTDGEYKYLVKWRGERWADPKWNEWKESDDVEESLIEEFEATRRDVRHAVSEPYVPACNSRQSSHHLPHPSPPAVVRPRSAGGWRWRQHRRTGQLPAPSE